jgi:hypothetical protein
VEYDQAARKRLGRAVRAARTSAGYDNRNDFADKMKRSARQVQALENGESGVGPDTWAAAAEALGWPIERVYALLDGETQAAVAPPELAAVSDEELAAEVLRRMQAGGEHGGDTAATKDPGSGPGKVTRLPTAAHKPGKLSKGQQRQRNADQAGEPDPDDPTDLEPR